MVYNSPHLYSIFTRYKQKYLSDGNETKQQFISPLVSVLVCGMVLEQWRSFMVMAANEWAQFIKQPAYFSYEFSVTWRQ